MNLIKMRQVVFIFVLILVASMDSFAQEENHFTLQGSVSDSASGERIPFANISIVGTSIGAIGDKNGFFIIRGIPRVKFEVRVASVGYKTTFFPVEPDEKESMTIQLNIAESPTTMQTIEVTGSAASQLKNVAGATFIGAKDLKSNVSIFSGDVTQYVTQLPGVVTTSGVTSQYYVRGGGADQNEVLIDRMRIYNLSHAFGLFSFVDPLIVKSANFSAGGFQAEYGDRMSSVLDIQTINGNQNRYGSSGSVDLLSANVMLEGPIPIGLSDGASFVAHFRKPLSNDVMNRFFSFSLPDDFYDGFFKATSNWGKTGLVSFEILSTSDKVTGVSQNDADFHWRDISWATTADYLFGDKFNLEVSISSTSYKAEQIPLGSSSFKYELSQISDPSLYFNLNYFTESHNELDFGLWFAFPSFQYAFSNAYNNSVSGSNSPIEPSVWVKYKWNVSPRLSLEPGLRVNMSQTFPVLAGAGYGYLAEPRFNISYLLTDEATVYAAFGRYHQSLINLSDENDIYTPFDLIVSPPDSVGEESSYHYIVGTSLSPNVLTTVRVEAYYKNFDRLIGINRVRVYPTDPIYEFGNGKAYGVDLSARYDIGSYYLDMNYSFARVIKTMAGVTYPPRYDVRHLVNATAGLQPMKNLWLRAHWKFSSGLPYTPISGFYGLINSDPFDLKSYTSSGLSGQVAFGQQNSARLPSYQSLDLTVSYDVNVFGSAFTLQGMVINVYDRKNVFYINNVTGDVEYQIPVLVNLSLAWKI